MQSYCLNLLGLVQYFLLFSEKNKQKTHLTKPSPMPAFSTINFTYLCHIVLWMSALRPLSE